MDGIWIDVSEVSEKNRAIIEISGVISLDTDSVILLLNKLNLYNYFLE